MAKRPRRPHLLRHEALSGTAYYRVVGSADDCVIVEVVAAPGLRPGAQLRFTKSAVAQMPLVDEEAWRRGRGVPPGGGHTAGGIPALRRVR
jgi:CO/xanthine dehydrogenase FAD-binding subunit